MIPVQLTVPVRETGGTPVWVAAVRSAGAVPVSP